MTSTIPILLCLGLHLGLKPRGSEGSTPKPILWAEPGPMIPKLGSVTIWCQGTSAAQRYQLCVEGTSRKWEIEVEKKLGNKVNISISPMKAQYAGQYRCYYDSPEGWSEGSEPLELVMTGFYAKPSLSSLTSTVMTLGGNVTFQCVSQLGLGTFVLMKEGEISFSHTLNSHQHLQGHVQAMFPLGPIMQSHKGIYRCYGYHKQKPHVWSGPSDPLELLVSGNSMKPSLLTQHSTVLTSGENLTLQCRSDVNYDRFIVVKDGGLDLPQCPAEKLQDGFFQATFPLGPVSRSHGGRYRCCGAHNLSSVCSASSEPLDMLIVGQLPYTPSLSVQSCPSGERMILLCQSETKMNTFLLTKEGTARPLQHLRSIFLKGNYQAEFSMSTMNSSLGEPYRCYGSQDSRPFLLSEPSEPLYVNISGITDDQGLVNYQNALIAVLLAFLVLVFFILLRHRNQCKCRRSGFTSAVTSMRSSGSHQHSPEDESPQEVTYIQVNHSRQRCQQASCSSFSPHQLLDMKTAASEVSTYVEMNICRDEHLQVQTDFKHCCFLLGRGTTAKPSMCTAQDTH